MIVHSSERRIFVTLVKEASQTVFFSSSLRSAGDYVIIDSSWGSLWAYKGVGGFLKPGRKNYCTVVKKANVYKDNLLSDEHESFKAQTIFALCLSRSHDLNRVR